MEKPDYKPYPDEGYRDRRMTEDERNDRAREANAYWNEHSLHPFMKARGAESIPELGPESSWLPDLVAWEEADRPDEWPV